MCFLPQKKETAVQSVCSKPNKTSVTALIATAALAKKWNSTKFCKESNSDQFYPIPVV